MFQKFVLYITECIKGSTRCTLKENILKDLQDTP